MNSTAIPLFHDHHSHPLLYASLRAAVNLTKIESKTEAIHAMRAAADSMAPEQLLLVLGWRSNQFQWTEQDLESFPAVAIFNLSLHQLVVNRSGSAFLRERFGDDVDHIDDQDWYECNLRTVLNWFAGLNATEENLLQFFEELRSIGIESAEEMLLVDEHEIQLFESAGLLDRTQFWAAPQTYDGLTQSAREKVHGLKLFTDGALGAGTAALEEPYLNQGSNRGMLVYTDPQLEKIVLECLQRTPNLAIHAIGDRAIVQALAALKSASGSVPMSDVRIEHAQLISETMARLAKQLGVKLSMQPNFNSDSVHYADRMSKRYCLSNNPFRMLIDRIGFVPGQDLIFGSDGMPHGADAAIRESVTDALPHQKLTMDELIAGIPNRSSSESDLATCDSKDVS